MRYSGFLLLWLMVSASAFAAHVTDQLVIGLYAEPDTSGKPVRLLKSGASLDVKDRRAGFAKVKLADGQEGWIEASYVSEVKPASMRLLEAKARMVQLRARLEQTEQALLAAQEAGEKPALPLPVAPARPSPVATAPIAEQQTTVAMKQTGAPLWTIFGMLVCLFTGIAVGVGLVDYRLRRQFAELQKNGQ